MIIVTWPIHVSFTEIAYDSFARKALRRARIADNDKSTNRTCYAWFVVETTIRNYPPYNGL